MNRMHCLFTHLIPGLLLGFILGMPLHAQLDPRLQGSTTDFLDLYQKSSSAKVKPEILTIFDFSGSMSSLMYHPLYVNTDSSDSDDYRNMTFTLGTGSGSTGGTYVITATSAEDSGAYTSLTLKIGSSTSGATNSRHADTISFTAGTRNRNFNVAVSNISITPSETVTSGHTYTFSATVEFSVTNRFGTNFYPLSTYKNPLNAGLNWTVSGPASSTLSPTGTSSSTSVDYTSSVPWTSSSQSTQWVVPEAMYSSPVTATLNCSSGGLSGVTYIGTLTSHLLIKPDGTLVTSTDAANASTASGLQWASYGASDVRNWVCAASHVRFTATVGSDTRTIDVPIPWKITNRDSSGNPLSSVTVLDRQVKNGTTYGSGGQIELDKTYAVAGGKYVLSGGTSMATTTTLGNNYVMSYRPAYISWLFTGKYTDGSYAGRYIVYDAANASLAGGQGNISWGRGYGLSSGNWGTNIQVPQYNVVTRAYTGEKALDAAVNIVPALTRCQAIKNAAIRTWINHQAEVFWAFRFLDTSHETPSSSFKIDQNSANSISSSDPSTTKVDGGDSGWKLLNNTSAQGISSTSGNSVTNMARLARLFPANGTPLTAAMARGLAQFTDPNSVFNSVETGDDAPTQCMNHFLILFTDGIDNNNSGTNNPCATTPYITGAGTTSSPYAINAVAGNTAILGNISFINYSSTTTAYWNLFTYAGIAAHMADSTLGTSGTNYMLAPRTSAGLGDYTTSSDLPQNFLPFSIPSRNGVSYQHDNRITTMTVGVSLGGNYNDSSSPKRSLFYAAALGDPGMASWPDISTLVPFVYDATANNGIGGKASGSIYFFDATDPDTLSNDLNYAILSAIGSSLVNVTSNPNLPYIGASLGKQIYLGKFQPPLGGGVMWSGDLLMFPTKVDASGKTIILSKTGATPTALNASTATWSAATNLAGNRRWDARKLYTRIPGGSSLSSFTYTGDAYSNDTTGLKNYVAKDNPTAYPSGGTAQQALIQLMMGASATSPFNSTNTTANRANIMGDIIDSAPAYLEYKWADVSGRFPSGSTLQGTDRTRFRLVLVGTNQGWLHAFGETTAINSVAPDSTKPNDKVDLVTGESDELWSFMPTDFLANLDYMNTSTNSHAFMVDGSPTIYFLDLPPTAGGTGNGVFDGSADTIISPLSDTTHERAIAIIGLRKGGRSYYALNLHDPFSPTLQWSLVPDEATATNVHSRNKTGLTDAALATIISHMGYSTCAPSIGRILFNGVYKDAVFLGGGYSVPEIEAKFSSTTPPKLGRSVLAIDVYKGDILAAVDLISSYIGGNTVGPVASGLVPFEFFLGSGMAQRAYFLDMWGGLWSWGSKAVVSDTNSSYNAFRMDTSELQNWSKDTSKTSPYANTGVRKVYQDAGSAVTEVTTTTPHTYTFAGPLYTTLPSPFLLGTFPGKGHTDGTSGKMTAIPAAVGIAMVSGDRNDPLDFGPNRPANTRLTVVFDRQDSRAWNLDTADGPDDGIKTNAQLLNAGKWGADGAVNLTKAYGDAVITPGSSTYYLAPSTAANTQFGYYATFPDRQQDTSSTTVYHYSKGINSPLVVAGSLFYSYFTPTTADVCTGGSGFTYSNLICDVMNPIVKDVRTGIYCTSGNMYKWVNVASDFSMLGAPGVQQAGTLASTDPNTGKTITTMNTQTFLGLSQPRFPKARVWRTVH